MPNLSDARSITHADIEDYRDIRLATPTTKKKDPQRKIASVNRELEDLRAILNFAKRQGWLLINPFNQGEPLINKSAENRRERTLTPAEEERLLAACDDPKRVHLKAIIICALDTAMRRGEIFKLRWSDVSLEERLIRLRATTTKTLKTRTVGITSRLLDVLQRLRTVAPPDPDGLVFGIRSNVKHSFETACRIAEIEGFHFHDLRHCATTQIVQSGVMSPFAMKVTEHTQEATFRRYVNANEEAARLTAQALDEAQFERVRAEMTQNSTQTDDVLIH